MKFLRRLIKKSEYFHQTQMRHLSLNQCMNTVNKAIVESLERLALVDFSTDAGIQRLEQSIKFADKLMEVDTSGVEPLISTVYDRNDNLREDETIDKSYRKELMKITPVSEEFYYVAPSGYANEVGESFRAVVHKNVVRGSYVVAFGYVFADTADKVKKTDKLLDQTDPTRNRKLATSAIDTLVWQTLASVAIPGFTINRICASSLYIFKKYTKMPKATRKWTTVAIGLGCIPFIVKPIDNLVHTMMDHSFRKWF